MSEEHVTQTYAIDYVYGMCRLFARINRIFNFMRTLNKLNNSTENWINPCDIPRSVCLQCVFKFNLKTRTDIITMCHRHEMPTEKSKNYLNNNFFNWIKHSSSCLFRNFENSKRSFVVPSVAKTWQTVACGYYSISHIPNDVLEYETYSSNIRNTKKSPFVCACSTERTPNDTTYHWQQNTNTRSHTYSHATYAVAVQMSREKRRNFVIVNSEYPNTVLVEGKRVQFMFSLCTQQFGLHVCLRQKKIVLLFFRFSNWKKFHLILFS